MKCILTTLLLLVISLSLFSVPKGELRETKLDSQDSISMAVNKMEFSEAIAIIDRLLVGNLDSISG